MPQDGIVGSGGLRPEFWLYAATAENAQPAEGRDGRFDPHHYERLQTSHLDLYLFHTINAGGLEKVKRLGRIEKR